MPRKDTTFDNSEENEYDDIVPDENTEEIQIRGKSEKQLREELKQCHKEKQEYLDGWQRARADLINFKRESEEARQKFAKFATEDLVHQLLPVLDSFDAALEHLSAARVEKARSDDGVQHIYKQLLSVLTTNGVEQIDPVGETFDPTEHESVGTVQVENKNQDGTIVGVVQKGYTLHDKLIRPARVRVAEWKG